MSFICLRGYHERSANGAAEFFGNSVEGLVSLDAGAVYSINLDATNHGRSVEAKMVEHFRDGGAGMFLIFIFGMVLLAVAIRYAVKPEKKLVPLLYGLGVLTLSSGGLGFVTGLIVTAGAVGSNPDFHDRPGLITIIGFGESLNNLAFALIFVTLAAVAACVGATQIARSKNNEPENA